ncbi:hypothetical protein RhiirB3_435309 [Rhizophagus irregularis]|nr:hypothetical protein RhiirB3_435309 [Rhizophagus irregularis]
MSCSNAFLGVYDSEQDFRSLVIISLFKIFIENEVDLYTLEIKISNHACLDDILELIIKNQNFIHFVSKFENHNDNTIIYDRISQIIHLRQNHKKIKIIILVNNHTSLYQSLLLSKDYNLLEQLNVLESVHIFYCFSLNSFIQQIINLTKLFKLKSLFISNKTSQSETIQQLLQKSGDYLENLGFSYNESLIQQLLLKYCKNIKFLHFVMSESWLTYQLINLIDYIKQRLSCLSINRLEDNHLTNCSSMILQNLGQILPSKLDYINLFFNIKKRIYYEGKRVKYLAIKGIKSGKELFNLKDEVKEFEIHNIKIRSYNDLVISAYSSLINNINNWLVK